MGKFTITKTAGGLGRRNPSADQVSGLVMTAANPPAGLGFGVVAPLLKIEDAEALGITPAFDIAEVALAHHHISEFFRINPDGELLILLAADTNDLADMCDVANDFAKKLLKDSEGRIKQIGIARNPAPAYTPVLAGGLDDDVFDAIPLAQATYLDEADKKRFAHFIIEGRSFNGTVAAATDLRTLAAEHVSVVIAADPDISDNSAIYNGYAAVGAALGMASLVAVNESIGFAEKGNLTDASTGRFLEAGTSANNNVAVFEDDFDTLTAKGYIFARTYTGVDGVFFDNSATAILASSDFAFIENNRTIDKAAANIIVALTPRLNGPVLVDPTTGQLAADYVAQLEADGTAALDPMLEDVEISGNDVFVDPDQDVNATGKIVIKFKVVPIGVSREIEAEIGFAAQV